MIGRDTVDQVDDEIGVTMDHGVVSRGCRAEILEIPIVVDAALMKRPGAE
jgi:hypothetical protein